MFTVCYTELYLSVLVNRAFAALRCCFAAAAACCCCCWGGCVLPMLGLYRGGHCWHSPPLPLAMICCNSRPGLCCKTGPSAASSPSCPSFRQPPYPQGLWSRARFGQRWSVGPRTPRARTRILRVYRSPGWKPLHYLEGSPLDTQLKVQVDT